MLAAHTAWIFGETRLTAAIQRRHTDSRARPADLFHPVAIGPSVPVNRQDRGAASGAAAGADILRVQARATDAAKPKVEAFDMRGAQRPIRNELGMRRRGVQFGESLTPITLEIGRT